MTLYELWAYVREAGTLGVLLLIIVGGWRRWYVWSWYADELNKRIDRLEAQVDRATRVAETGAVSAERATRVAERTVEAADAR